MTPEFVPVPADTERLRIRRFVQERLGCACPDPVFDRIDLFRDCGGAALQLAIGGRLLIRVHVLGPAQDLLTELARWVADGARERDALALRRLRLVLGAENPEAVEAPARGAFQGIVAAFGDVHLHVHGLPALRAALGAELLPVAGAGADRRFQS